MKFKSHGPFTLFLCFCLICFILFSPYYIEKPSVAELYDKVFKKDIEWRGIITIWDYPRLDITTGYKYSWLRDKVNEFEKKHPGVVIEFKALDPQYGHIELDTAIKTNTYPDIAPVGTDYELISKGIIEPLDQFISEEEKDAFTIQAITAVKFQEKIYGLPYKIEPYTLLINKRIFEEKEVELPKDGNWSYEEFVDTLKKLTFKKGKKATYGFNSYIGPLAYNTWGIIMSDGADIFSKDYTYKFYDDKAVAGFKKLYDLKHTYKLTPEDFGVNSKSEAWKSFAIDKNIAVYPAKSSEINELRILKSNGKGFEFDVANYPVGDLGIPISVGNPIEAFAIFKQEDPDKLKMCVKLIKFLTDEESQKELYKQGVFPVKKNIDNIYKNDEIMNKLQNNLSYSKDIGQHSNWSSIEDILQSQLRMVLMGEKSPEEAIQEAKQRVNKISTD